LQNDYQHAKTELLRMLFWISVPVFEIVLLKKKKQKKTRLFIQQNVCLSWGEWENHCLPKKENLTVIDLLGD